MSDVITTTTQELIRNTVERLERLDEEKKAIAEDMKEVMGQAKAMGIDPKIIRQVIAIRKKALHERQEEEALLGLYLQAVEGGDLPT